MAYLITLTDLKTHIYTEIVDEITRADNTIAQEAIDTAIAEAKGYLNRYDLLKLFGSNTVNPEVTDSNLKSKVKDLVRWHLVTLGSVNIDYATAESRYKYAIEYYFERVQSGKIAPEGWPYKDASTLPAPAKGNGIEWSSNTKRNNHY